MSQVGTLDKTDWRKAGKAALVWFAPVVLIYVNSVLGSIQGDGHVIKLVDFVPNTFTIHAIVVWFMMQIQGLFLRFITK